MKLWMKVAICLLYALAGTGCAGKTAFRTELVSAETTRCDARAVPIPAACQHVTPEVSRNAYELHFVEFDDEGWTYPKPVASITGDEEKDQQDWSQIDHVLGRLKTLLEEKKEDISIILYVHGWKHQASYDDSDVVGFRALLQNASSLENVPSAIKGERRDNKPRRVVGIYVGWRGKSLNLPSLPLSVTFWARKNAALRVSHGSVQDLFSRMRALQQYYNAGAGCAEEKAIDPFGKEMPGDRKCRIRSLMIGHSFGAWILYSAVSGPLIDFLNASRDIPDTNPDYAKLVRAQRLADMIVLLNPAFEAARYEPLHRASRAYRPKFWQPPVLVSITSTADDATAFYFPLGQTMARLSGYLLNNSEERKALSRTMGNVNRLKTHRLTRSHDTDCPALGSDPHNMNVRNASERDKSTRFFTEHQNGGALLSPGWVRGFCGGAELTHMVGSGTENNDPNALVWNIETDETMIESHNDIQQPILIDFVRQLYNDTIRPPLLAAPVAASAITAARP